MRSDSRRPITTAAAAIACALLLSAIGCRGGGPEESSGPEALRRLPPQVAELVPEDAILCLDDARPDDSYRIWILRRPGGAWLEFPAARARGKSAARAESHDMPASALTALLHSRLPNLDPGRTTEPRCRFTHWRLPDGAEVQVREFVTDRGWFASVERVAM